MEVELALLLPAGLQGCRPLWVGGLVVSQADRRGCALKNVEVLCIPAQVWNQLHARREIRAGVGDGHREEDQVIDRQRAAVVEVAARGEPPVLVTLRSAIKGVTEVFSSWGVGSKLPEEETCAALV